MEAEDKALRYRPLDLTVFGMANMAFSVVGYYAGHPWISGVAFGVGMALLIIAM